MRLEWVRIKNYRSCKDVRVDLEGMHALVGANGAGKSTILRALDFLFNPSKTKLDEEVFWNGHTEEPVWVEALFSDLTEEERQNDRLKPYLRPDDTFHIARSARIQTTTDEGEPAASEETITIGQHFCKPMPEQAWLRDSEINGKSIEGWWKEKDQLVVNGVSFAEFVGADGKQPKVTVWKEKAKEFVDLHLGVDDLVDKWTDNPQGYAGVLKGTLPHFVFVPAVRDVSEEAKVTKSNPFGRLLYGILSGITEEQRAELEQSVGSLDKRLNRAGGEDRFDIVSETEKRLNDLLGEYMSCDLEIEFQPPTLETVLTAPQIFVDDGFRNVVSNKGHGLQRAVIFAILQCYAEQVTGRGASKKKTMLLAVEEPELYMHPMAQRTIRRVFRQIAEGRDQVVFSTHSALLVDVAYFDEIVRVESASADPAVEQGVMSKVWQLPMQAMIDDLKARHPSSTPSEESMRDLYSHAYHPNRSEGFFAKRVVLVEGPTEHYALPIYASACGIELDALNVGIVDCGGKGQMDRLYRIFNELGIACYLVFDYDASSKDADTVEKSRDLLKLLGADDEAPAAALITPRFACFPEKWETSMAEYIDNLQELVAEARSFLGLSKDGGKPLIARYIARSLTAESPPRVPEPIADILRHAIEVAWEGSCLRCVDAAEK